MNGPKARFVADLKELHNSLKQDGYIYLLNIVDAFTHKKMYIQANKKGCYFDISKSNG